MLFYPVMFFLVLTSFALQEFVPPVTIAFQASLFLPAVVFFAVAAATPLPVMLLLALLTGLLWDARHLPPPAFYTEDQAALAELAVNDASVLAGGQLPFGGSIILFALGGALMQGIRPMFSRRRMELPVLMVGVCVLMWLLLQFLVMTFLRGSFSFPFAVWSKMITSSLLSMLVAPALFLFLHGLAGLLRHEIRLDGLQNPFNGR
jgi:hypothetical protein